MFTIDVLPAERGDCLWLTYGEGDDLHHVLIDGGPVETLGTLVPDLEARIKAVPGGQGRIELLVVTHIDADHIQGVVSLLSDPSRPKLFKDIWFNGYRHLIGQDVLGANDGERLTAVLDPVRPRWNRAFKGKAVVVPDDGPLPVKKLAGGLELTLLSPMQQGLDALVDTWEEECALAGLHPGRGAAIPKERQRSGVLGFDPTALAKTPFRRDKSKPNRSSIAFIASYGGASVLCGADAHADVLSASLDRLGEGPHDLSAVKLPHHGSKGNVDLPFLRRIRSKRWLVSTNGAKFHHPDPEALARVVVTQKKPTFYLNYREEETADLVSQAGSSWKVVMPRASGGVSIKLA